MQVSGELGSACAPSAHLQGYEIRLDDVPPNVRSWEPPVSACCSCSTFRTCGGFSALTDRCIAVVTEWPVKCCTRAVTLRSAGSADRTIAARPCLLQSLRAPAGPAQAAAGKPPVEFDQAISYVNKIKVRSGSPVVALGQLTAPDSWQFALVLPSHNAACPPDCHAFTSGMLAGPCLSRAPCSHVAFCSCCVDHSSWRPSQHLAGLSSILAACVC